jgi:hypothetical protein
MCDLKTRTENIEGYAYIDLSYFKTKATGLWRVAVFQSPLTASMSSLSLAKSHRLKSTTSRGK